MMKLKIGQVAKQAQVNIDTIRYYEKEGLLPKAERSESGYRLYTEDAIAHINFIKRAQELGFSLHEIQELLALKSSSDQVNCDEVRDKANRKLEDIEAKIATLENMRSVMQELICACKERKASENCPILKALEHEHGE